MIQALKKYMPDGVQWTKPVGGLFLMVYLPKHINAKELLAVSAENKVVFVIGDPFYCDGTGKNTLRLNYSFPSIRQIVEGIKRLAESIEDFIVTEDPLSISIEQRN